MKRYSYWEPDFGQEDVRQKDELTGRYSPLARRAARWPKANVIVAWGIAGIAPGIAPIPTSASPPTPVHTLIG